MRRDARGRAWEAYFTITTRLAGRLEHALKTTYQLSLPEYNVLLQAHRAGKLGIRSGVLAHEVVFSPSRLTHTLKRLAERGLLTRTPCPVDGRGAIITITDEGSELFAKAADLHRSLVRHYALDGMEEAEAKALQTFFARVEARLNSE